MPSMPPFSRREKIEDYEKVCRPVVWREERIRSGDGVEVALAVGSVPLEKGDGGEVEKRDLVVLYFQGNGSSLPPRLPGLSQVLKSLHNSSPESGPQVTIVALSYRGFWTSKGRPSERGIILDAAAALDWISATFPSTSHLVLWGQSIGAGVAVRAVAAHGRYSPSTETRMSEKLTTAKDRKLGIKGLLLETPFTSVKDMLAAIYPQTWLPYRYLWPFLRSHWNSLEGLSHIAASRIRPKVLLLQAGGDELVPQPHGEVLEAFCKRGQMDVKRLVVSGALHHEVLSKPQGRTAIVEFLKEMNNSS